LVYVCDIVNVFVIKVIYNYILDIRLFSLIS